MPPSKIQTAFLEAAQRLARRAANRRTPSPSSVAKCHRRNWFQTKLYPADNFPDNGESYISAQSGTASEAVLSDIVEEMGYTLMYAPDDVDARELSPDELVRMNMSGGQVDNVATDNEGVHYLVEFKRKGVYDMKSLARSQSVLEAIPDDYIQLQSLMHAKGLQAALYVVAGWDRGSWTSTTRYKGQLARWATEVGFTERPDNVYVEIVWYNASEAAAAAGRAAFQRKLMDERDEPADVPREYDPFKEAFPCTWCPWMNACKKAG